MKSIIPALPALLALAACGGLPIEPGGTDNSKTVVESPPSLPSPSEEILALLDRVSSASPGELSREYESLAAIPEPSRGADSQLRLALLLAQPGLPMRDDASALRALQEWERRQPAASPEQRAFARWLRLSLYERLRQAGTVDESVARLKEERRRAEQCREKLEAIRTMEKSLIERDKR